MLRRLIVLLLSVTALLTQWNCRTFAGADPLPDVYAAVGRNSSFSIFRELLDQTGWSSKLQARDAEYTLFAPVNEAFQKIGAEKLAALRDPANSAMLKSVIEKHIFRGALEKESLITAGTTPPSVSGESFPVRNVQGKWYVGNAHPIRNPLNAKNGILYVVEDLMGN